MGQNSAITVSINALALTLSGPRFTNGFSIAIQIRWKFRFPLISILIQWSLQNFVNDTTAVLSWHVQKFLAIWWPATELQQSEVSIEFELRAKIVSETGPRIFIVTVLTHVVQVTADHKFTHVTQVICLSGYRRFRTAFANFYTSNLTSNFTPNS